MPARTLGRAHGRRCPRGRRRRARGDRGAARGPRRARTLLGDEAAGQEVMRRAFSGLGLDPVDVPLDPAALAPARRRAVQLGGRRQGERHRGLARPGGRDGPLADPQRSHRRRQPRAVVAVALRPVRAASRRRVDVRPRRGRHEGGPRGDRRRGARRCTGSGRAGRAGRAAVRRRGGVHRQRRGGLRARRQPRRRAVITEPTGGAIWNAQVGVLWFSVRVAGAPRPRRRGGERRERDRGDGPRDRGAARARGRAERLAAAAVRGPPAPDQPQRRHDPRRRLAVDRRGRVRRRDAPRALPRRGRGRPAPRIEETVAAARRADAFLARCTVEVRYDGFACEGYVLERDP